jgi:two-component system phosphate regulon sensor histidine kinase PhoR
MTHKKLIWQIFPANLIILAITVTSIIWFGQTSLRDFYMNELETDLVARAFMAKPAVKEMLLQGEIDKLRKYTKITGRETSTRITVILADGKVVADSNEDPDVMEDHRLRSEIVTAMAGDPGKSLRYSRTVKQEMLYVAIPLRDTVTVDPAAAGKQGIFAVLRLSVPAVAIDTALQRISSRILLAIVIFVILAAFASLLVSRNISRPLEEMKRAAERFAKGNFSKRMSAMPGKTASLEIASLAASMDAMAEELETMIETIDSQRYELETVFSSMIESVIAVDTEERIMNINDSAARLLGVGRESAKGKMVQEVLRNINLQQQIAEVLASGNSIEDEIIHQDNEGERFLQTNLVSLNDKKNNVLGVLVVMNDVTRLRRLENVRRDFVANVSHELRTPITSIRGYVETLLDGALENTEDSVKFLEIVLRQVERLNEIIEDLLALSRIEQEADNGRIQREYGNLCMVLNAAIETCQLKAAEEHIKILLDCPRQIMVEMNTTLLEQAVVNLLVNAIKYSKEGGTVTVAATIVEASGQRMAKIDVIDAGIGIAARHLPRLFERFYRSDKARSRKHGGTGLGLAIVKHIVQAHNGGVEVKSREGEGTTFTITLPGAEGV